MCQQIEIPSKAILSIFDSIEIPHFESTVYNISIGGPFAVFFVKEHVRKSISYIVYLTDGYIISYDI